MFSLDRPSRVLPETAAAEHCWILLAPAKSRFVLRQLRHLRIQLRLMHDIDFGFGWLLCVLTVFFCEGRLIRFEKAFVRSPQTRPLRMQKLNSAATAETATVPRTLADLRGLDRRALEELFLNGDGSAGLPLATPGSKALAKGLPIAVPGRSIWARMVNGICGALWKGKEFSKTEVGNGEEITFTNVVLGGRRVFRARVYMCEKSRAGDGRPVVLLDFSTVEGNAFGSGFVRRCVDEMRLVNPETRLYIGQSYYKERLAVWYGLQFSVSE
ncbi:unnamed protein product [Vitrella brassicaformis CCMP3155]|uniref:Uncharacterized protein n=1 Tax=Vitrella brassicaformis (strain CCMP3155) TaxID=1169540 RepID=A0A0G4ETR7_VITBC|nr:unnamed protein product [Vitrella brassicaformis CCMP3155]|eukprot:CEM01649.1 unnamed protein product [Vitrella brassicaformis CCMP3155]